MYGEDDHAISITNPFNAAVANLHFDYSTFNQICNDIDDARIYGGIHFPFDQVAGNRLGRELATYVYKHNLRKANGPQSSVSTEGQEIKRRFFFKKLLTS